ncbi:Beta-galactosidase 13 [Sesamum alatum]|uniref:Beta-galactosidase n=1 Tax=Sesamum alatum TaxID=300844 RepID=A0AAE1YWN4_9LAMI|nr:Beta-galactosidase 13 [Sesamum alatum]
MVQLRIAVLLVLLPLLLANVYGDTNNQQQAVTYDGRSVIINGSRELLFSGSVHYPRSTPTMWPDIIRKSKEGGLNVIQTYVFWNIHEPVEGQFNFEGNYDLVKFIKLIGEEGLWVTLRIGPYIEAEWNLGGFPYWLKGVKNITFRSYNEPFLHHMKKYAEKIIGLMKEHKLFADQGGPIIMAQIENEYNNVQEAYRDAGHKYVKWAAELAVNLHSGIPWLMCKQRDAPDTVISTCNGRQCGDTFPGPNGPNKPSLWTENWTAQYRVYGDAPSQRAAEDIAFAVARFFAKNGTLNNYYMYHGGTNFGRTSSSFVTSRYYDEAPLDEFGLKREPKFGHLRDLHRALRLIKKALFKGTPRVQKINQDLEIITFEKEEGNICGAFLTNNGTKEASTIKFRGVDYYLPPKSISILPDCKTVVYNTQTVVAQHSSRNFVLSKKAKVTKWEMFKEKVPTAHELSRKSKSPEELYDLAKDTSDYAWYSTSITFDKRDLPMRSDISPILQVASLGHALLAFVNGKYIGFGHGSNVEKSHVFKKSINLTVGVNHISLLAMTVGLPNSGAYMEKRFAGPRAITIQGLMAGTLDITRNYWGQEGYFDAPEGDNPVALKMMSMAKGMVWINGQSIGRYWVSYLSPLGRPTQEEYHVPRSFLKPTNNLIVVFEETGGDPRKIEILVVNRDTICSVVSEYHPGHVHSWDLKDNKLRSNMNTVKGAHLACPDRKIIEKVEFVSFGEADGACGAFTAGKCDSTKAHKLVEKECLGKTECAIPFDRKTLQDPGNDPCPDIEKQLAVQVKCGVAGGAKSDA